MNTITTVLTYQQIHMVIAGIGCLRTLFPQEPPQFVRDVADKMLDVYGTEDPQPDTSRYGEVTTFNLTEPEISTAINAIAAVAAFIKEGVLKDAPYDEATVEAAGQDVLNILVAYKQAQGETITAEF